MNSIISIDEVSKHNKKDDCWVIVNDDVYNVTTYLDIHPGSVNAILKKAGTDVSNDIKFHRPIVWEHLKKYKIGSTLTTLQKIFKFFRF